MKVIIVKPTKKIKKTGELLVKKGYARNYLIPMGIAIKANDENLKHFESSKHDIDAKHAASHAQAVDNLPKLENAEITFISQSLEDGKLFGSISSKQIAKALNEKFKVELKYDNIHLNNPIKNIGVYNIEVALHPEVFTNVVVNVARSDSEAANQLSSFLAKREDNKAKDKA